MWLHILVKPGGGMIARNENYEVGAELIAYLVGSESMDQEKLDAFAARYDEMKRTTDEEIIKLPDPITE
jgi:hypothetical protein